MNKIENSTNSFMFKKIIKLSIISIKHFINYSHTCISYGFIDLKIENFIHILFHYSNKLQMYTEHSSFIKLVFTKTNKKNRLKINSTLVLSDDFFGFYAIQYNTIK